MFVAYNFKVGVGNEMFESPTMGTGDVELLKKLFPKSTIWKFEKSPAGNQMFPTADEMRLLYDELVRYFVEVGVGTEEFQTGNFSGTFAVISSVRSLFRELFVFCEEKLGFQKPAELKEAALRRENQYLKEEADVRAQREGEMLSVFKGISHISKPGDSKILDQLRQKLAEYKVRLSKSYRHPQLAFAIEAEYRDATYKIEIISSLLSLDAGGEFNLVEMVTQAIKQRRESFSAEEYLNAYGVIAHYAGQPFKDSYIQKENWNQIIFIMAVEVKPRLFLL